VVREGDLEEVKQYLRCKKAGVVFGLSRIESSRLSGG
jgi:hypothetical protein